jgi:cytochrome b561
MQRARYTRTAIVLHWIIALGVLTQFFLGWWMQSLPDKTGVQAWWFNLHKSIGLTVLLCVVAVLAWRIRNPAPVLPSFMPPWQQRLAKLVHYGIYACLIIMPVAGYLGSSFTRFPIKYWGMMLPRLWTLESAQLKYICSVVHFSTSIVLMALVALHIAGALMHVVQRDGIFGRMWGWPLPSTVQPAPEPAPQSGRT